MKILVTESAYRSAGAEIDGAVPGVEFVVLGDDRSLRVERSSPVTDDGTEFEVAWGSQGVFRETGPGSFIERLGDSKTLRWFQSFSAGNDRPIIGELIERGVKVTGSHVNNIPISEFIMRAVLEQFENTEAWRVAERAQRWEPHPFREVYRTQWLIIGVGAIGSAVAVRARAFGATVVGVRRTPAGDEPVDKMITPEDILSALPESDVVVLAAPGTASTHHLVNREFLAAMKPGSVLVNTARGSLVDDAALLEALDRGAPEAAILDNTVPEPLPAGHPFWTHPKIALSPHSSARGSGLVERVTELFIENLRRYIEHRPMLHVVTEP